VIAEQLVAWVGELNVVLPLDVDKFEERSVRPSGDTWLPRFRSLLQLAALVPSPAICRPFGDDNRSPPLAMSRRATRAIEHGCSQRRSVRTRPGTANLGLLSHDTRGWRRTGGLTHAIPLSTDATIKTDRADEKCASPGVGPTRVVPVVLFADFGGFSVLRAEHYSTVVDSHLLLLADSVEPYRLQLLLHKTWCDGIQLVFKTVATAGRAAVAMQESANRLQLPSLPADMTLRIGARVGPS